MLISTFILTLLPRPINMYFLKYKKQIHFNHEQVKASGEPIQKWGKSTLVSWFQQTYTIRSVLPVCHFRINVLWEEATQMLPKQSEECSPLLSMNGRWLPVSWDP